jgi:hypothetical protein
MRWKITEILGSKVLAETRCIQIDGERDETNVRNDDVFRSVCSTYLRPIFVVHADMTHSP